MHLGATEFSLPGKIGTLDEVVEFWFPTLSARSLAHPLPPIYLSIPLQTCAIARVFSSLSAVPFRARAAAVHFGPSLYPLQPFDGALTQLSMPDGAISRQKISP